MAKASVVAARQKKITAPLGRRILRLLLGLGVPVTDGQRDEVARVLFPIILEARQRAYQAAVADFLEHADRAGAPVSVAPERRYKPDAVVKLLENATDPTGPVGGRVTVKELDPATEKATKTAVRVDESNRNDSQVVKVVADRVRRGVEHHVRAAARDMVADTQALSRDKPIGYARMLTGSENCAFCAMLASRGPVYRTKETASEKASPDIDPVTGLSITTYHIGCDCVTVPVFDEEDWEGVDAFDALQEFWYDVQDDDANADEHGHPPSGKAAIRAFRRAWEKKLRENGGVVPDEFLPESVS